MTSALRETFKKGSRTYFNSSLFFPPEVRQNVFRLYGFVRVADNFVDSTPQDKDGFYHFVSLYRAALQGQPSNNEYIDSFVDLSREKSFDPAWAEAFLRSMEMDLYKQKYQTLDETLEYIYGSAEVIGMFMASLLGLDPRAYSAACMLGRSMQYINFIRDLAEDHSLGRTYLPLQGTGFSDLSEASARQDPQSFVSLIREQAALYLQWQQEAETGYAWIPYRSLIPIKTAADMYQWTARQIMKDPFVVYRKKIKPARVRILGQLLWNTLTLRRKRNA